jgi:hypothetical protein
MTTLAFFALGMLPVQLVWIAFLLGNITRLQRVVKSLAARVAAQSEALSQKAERPQPATLAPLQGGEKPKVPI